MDQLENDKPFSNGDYNNDCGEEINSVPSNERGAEINNAELISKRSKSIAKTITSAVVILAMIALFSPVFLRACNKMSGINFKNLFACEISDYTVYASSLEYDINFSRLDEKTGEIVDGEINVKNYGVDIILVLSNSNERYEKTVTDDIIDNEYHASFQGLTDNTEYTLTIKIGDDIIFEEKYSTLPNTEETDN